MAQAVTHVVVGPQRHGVARFGADLVRALRHNGVDVASVSVPTIDRLPVETPRGGVHLQFTDRLFGSTPAQAAGAVVELAGAAHAHGARVTVTLHDVPQPSDGAHHRRRRQAYREIIGVAAGILLNSDHEHDLLVADGVFLEAVEVVPLPIEPDIVATPARASVPTVGIFGFVYPGKGHEEVLAAMSGADPAVELVALGEASDGHDNLGDRLHTLGAAAGRRFRLTGHIPDGSLVEALRKVTVPVAHHRHVSASGSLNSWISAGRRPLAPSNRYTREIAARNPGALLLYPDTDDGLRTAIEKALADPASTWLASGTVCAPSWREAAARYADVLDRWHR